MSLPDGSSADHRRPPGPIAGTPPSHSASNRNTSVPSRAAPAPLSLVPTRFRFPRGTGGAVPDTYPTDTDAFRSTITTRVTAGRSQIPTR